MSAWTHPICDTCWEGLNPGREPYRMTIPMPERCCVCAEETQSGIYFREDPRLLPVHSEHLDEDEL